MSNRPAESPFDIARDVLEGRLDLISGCRRMLRYRGTISGVSDDAWDTITGLESETDAIPVGDQRAAWDPAALRAKDAKAAQILSDLGPAAKEAFVEIFRAFGER